MLFRSDQFHPGISPALLPVFSLERAETLTAWGPSSHGSAQELQTLQLTAVNRFPRLGSPHLEPSRQHQPPAHWLSATAAAGLHGCSRLEPRQHSTHQHPAWWRGPRAGRTRRAHWQWQQRQHLGAAAETLSPGQS